MAHENNTRTYCPLVQPPPPLAKAAAFWPMSWEKPRLRKGPRQTMAKIKYVEFGGKEHIVEVANGLTVMEGARDNGIPGIEADCGGAAPARPAMSMSPPNGVDRLPAKDSMEEDMLDFAYKPDPVRSRLTCQLKVSAALDGLVVHMPEKADLTPGLRAGRGAAWPLERLLARVQHGPPARPRRKIGRPQPWAFGFGLPPDRRITGAAGRGRLGLAPSPGPGWAAQQQTSARHWRPCAGGLARAAGTACASTMALAELRHSHSRPRPRQQRQGRSSGADRASAGPVFAAPLPNAKGQCKHQPLCHKQHARPEAPSSWPAVDHGAAGAARRCRIRPICRRLIAAQIIEELAVRLHHDRRIARCSARSYEVSERVKAKNSGSRPKASA